MSSLVSVTGRPVNHRASLVTSVTRAGKAQDSFSASLANEHDKRAFLSPENATAFLSFEESKRFEMLRCCGRITSEWCE